MCDLQRGESGERLPLVETLAVAVGGTHDYRPMHPTRTPGQVPNRREGAAMWPTPPFLVPVGGRT